MLAATGMNEVLDESILGKRPMVERWGIDEW